MVYNPHHIDEIQTECVWCGGYIHAGSYPPICRDEKNNCRFEIRIAIAYQKMAKEYNERTP